MGVKAHPRHGSQPGAVSRWPRPHPFLAGSHDPPGTNGLNGKPSLCVFFSAESLSPSTIYQPCRPCLQTPPPPNPPVHGAPSPTRIPPQAYRHPFRSAPSLCTSLLPTCRSSSRQNLPGRPRVRPGAGAPEQPRSRMSLSYGTDSHAQASCTPSAVSSPGARPLQLAAPWDLGTGPLVAGLGPVKPTLASTEPLGGACFGVGVNGSPGGGRLTRSH